MKNKKILIICLFLQFTCAQAQQISYGDNCYKHNSKIWQNNSMSEIFYAQIKLFENPTNDILDSFYTQFRNYKSGIYFYESATTFMNLAPIQYKGYLFSHIIVIDKKQSNKQCYLMGHFLRNFSLMNFPNLNYSDSEIIKIESPFMKEKFEGNCTDVFEPIFFVNNKQDWKNNKSLIEEKVILYYLALRKYYVKNEQSVNGLFDFENFVFSANRQSYLNIHKIKSKVGISEKDKL